jgi:hypothetical protein
VPLAPLPARLACLFCLLVAPALAARAPVPSDGRTQLERMKRSVEALRSLHAEIEQAERDEERVVAARVLECWIDVPGQRAYTRIRDRGRATHHLVTAANERGIRFRQLEAEEVARADPQPLWKALAAGFSGELLATAFRGDLVTFKVAAHGEPRAGKAGEIVGGTGCTRVTFGGNADADLWIGDADGIPRRLRGPLGGALLEETILLLEPDADLAGVEFDLPVPDGFKLLDVGVAAKRWASLGPEEERWPKPMQDAPDFAALDLDGEIRKLSETGEEDVILAMWSPEDAESARLAAEAERCFGEQDEVRGALRFLHVAAGGEREPVARLVAELAMKQPVWVAGGHERNAFRQFRVWRCPAFVRISDMQILEMTRDLAQVRRWLE